MYNCLPDEDGHDYESALELSGYGWFHYWLAFICGWANASDAVEILCISFLLPSAGVTNKKFPLITEFCRVRLGADSCQKRMAVGYSFCGNDDRLPA